MIRASSTFTSLIVIIAVYGSLPAYGADSKSNSSDYQPMNASGSSVTAKEDDDETDGEAHKEDAAESEDLEDFEDGGLVTTYENPETKALQPIAKELQETEVFEEVVESVNETYRVPKMQVIFGECKKINAFYIRGQNKIIMCYELFKYLNDRFAEDKNLSQEEVKTKLTNAMIFIFFHELGHGLADVLELPITGREEDAVDDLATLTLLEAEEDEGAAISDAIDSFWINAEESLDDVDFWGEHSLNNQRAARMVCLAYGSNPEKFSEWIGGEDGLPVERAEKCKGEFEVMSNAWSTLLGPYIKEE